MILSEPRKVQFGGYGAGQILLLPSRGTGHYVRERGRSKGGMRMQPARPGVVCSAAFDWKPLEESFRRRAEWSTSLLAMSGKDLQMDAVKIAEFLRENVVAVYGGLLGLVGFRLSITLGMGWTIIGAVLLTTAIGYALCLQQAVEGERAAGRPVDVQRILLEAQFWAFQSFSYRAEAGSSGQNSALMVVSSLFEPSPIYLMLNCWAVYAIGQCVLCKSFGGGLLLIVSIASLLLGRWLQFAFWKHFSMVDGPLAPSKGLPQHSQGTSTRPSNSIPEMLFAPNGTWGIGPIFNGVVWFGALMLPFVQYPSSPVVMAPLWTALCAPALLLLEDIISLASKHRRQMKYSLGMGPGLQLGSFLVGITCALAVRSLHQVAFQLW